MGSSEVRNRRLEQVEQMLASSLTVKEWCKLNKVAESHHTQLAASACERAFGAILDVGRDVLDDEMANNEAEESGQSPWRLRANLREACGPPDSEDEKTPGVPATELQEFSFTTR